MDDPKAHPFQFPSAIVRLLIALLAVNSVSAKPLFREDFKEVPAHIPPTPDDLTSEFLGLERLGPGADQLKLSFHPEVKNDPHYIWNGECAGPVLIGFPFKKSADLTDAAWTVKLQTKNVGQSTLHLALRAGGKWIVQNQPVANRKDWNTQSLKLHGGVWKSLDPTTVTFGQAAKDFDFSKVDAMGFAAPKKPNRSKDCIRLDWFELVHADRPEALPKNGFLENETPFLRTALVGNEKAPGQTVRRGVVLPIGQGYWACFDPDLLRWAVHWKAPAGKAPLSYDSMASVSFPNAKAKATRAPRLVGSGENWSPALPGAAQGTIPRSDPRSRMARGTNSPVGPLPVAYGRWMGITLADSSSTIHYQIGDTEVSEVMTAAADGTIWRLIKIGPTQKPLSFLTASPEWELSGNDARLSGQTLTATPSAKPRLIRLHLGRPGNQPPEWPAPRKASGFPEGTITVKAKAPVAQGPFSVRNLDLPRTTRPVRPSDLGFLSDGTAIISTLDGDIWKVTKLDRNEAEWQRIATGLFEPMGVATWKDRIFVLGRDQITELIDTNQDGVTDLFRNASDAFLQTIHTRDFATSLDIAADGSFIVAKGGISNTGKQSKDEISDHRGTILRISPDGNTTNILADGLRMPFGGLRHDGTVFSSDQQGHFIPSTPIHQIGRNVPFLGFSPTNHRASKKLIEPLLFYPYQANRSAAGFANVGASSFKDFANNFVQISWNGSLFGIVTSDTPRPFSWQWPLQLDFPSLKAATHPVSGRLYVTGLGISAYKATTPEPFGLASIEQPSPFPTPTSMAVQSDRIEVTFNRPLQPNETVIPATPALRMFDVKRSPKYGSGHSRWDGKPGEHQFQPKRFALSTDRRTLALTFDALRRSEILDLHLSVSIDGNSQPLHLFTRPSHLPEATRAELISIAKREAARPKIKPGDRTRGEAMFKQYACAVCHSLADEKLTGPPLKGLGSRHDAAFLRQSILKPAAIIAEGYEPAMPSFEGVIPPQDLADLLVFLQSLK